MANLQRETLPMDVAYRLMREDANPHLVRKLYPLLAGAPQAQEPLSPIEAVQQLHEVIKQYLKRQPVLSYAELMSRGEKWLRAIYDSEEFADEVVRLWWETFPEFKAQAAEVQEDGVPR